MLLKLIARRIKAMIGGEAEPTEAKGPLLFLATSDPTSVRGFSGTTYFINRSMKENSDFEIIDGSLKYVELVAKVINRAVFILTKRKIDIVWHPLFGRAGAGYVALIVLLARPRAILAVACAPYVGYIKGATPVVYCSDTTFELISKLYPAYAQWPHWQFRSADKAEAMALLRADRVVYSSRWAQASAIDYYNTDAAKISVLPFGPNFFDANLPHEVTPSPSMQTCRLVFIGLDWQRKGGNIALDIHRGLRARGIQSELKVVGVVPPGLDGEAGLVMCGMIDKSSPDGAASIARILSDSHFLVLPTLADATPIVFSEASAFSVPSITFDVGGTADCVIDGVNGFVFPLHTPADVLTSKIADVWGDPDAYERLRATTFEHYRDRTNWAAWSRDVALLIRELASGGAPLQQP